MGFRFRTLLRHTRRTAGAKRGAAVVDARAEPLTLEPPIDTSQIKSLAQDRFDRADRMMTRLSGADDPQPDSGTVDGPQ